MKTVSFSPKDKYLIYLKLQDLESLEGPNTQYIPPPLWYWLNSEHMAKITQEVHPY